MDNDSATKVSNDNNCPDCPKTGNGTTSHSSTDGNTYSFSDGAWHLVGPTLIGLGAPLNFLKPVGALGSSPGSSIASYTLSKAIPARFTKALGVKIGTKIATKVGTNVIGRALGRLVPYAGWAMTALDVISFLPPVQSSSPLYNLSQNIQNGNICFEKGTKVFTENGFVPIEDVKINDKVYSFNLEKDKTELGNVSNVLSRNTDVIYELNTTKQRIFVTAEHPFYIVKKGWVKVKDIKKGDVLKSLFGKIKVKHIHKFIKNVTVYNIEVDGNHNYFVTDSKILVHNKKILLIKK